VNLIIKYKQREDYMNIREYKILLLDDESEILNHIENGLKQEGFYRIFKTSTLEEAKKTFLKEKPHILVLDIMLPDGDGYELLKYVRSSSDIPVIFLTAKDEDVDKLIGLGLGADDYITKPFIMKELVFRINAILRRSYKIKLQETENCILGDVIIDFSQNVVINNDKSVNLTAMEREILSKLYENKNRVLTKDAIADAIWGEDISGNEQSLIMHIRRIRNKIEENPSEPKYLKTIKGIGYKLIVN
jgi:DNA-binding response OmpR family regulator